jgi:hypothetical protein
MEYGIYCRDKRFKKSKSMSGINFSKLQELSDGDKEFHQELTLALFKSLLELKDKYHSSSLNKDIEGIKAIRHKIKPTLILFEITLLQNIIAEGKLVLEESGFSSAFDLHLLNFNAGLDKTISELKFYLDNNDFKN